MTNESLPVLPATLTWLGNSFSGDRAFTDSANFFPDTLQDIAVSRDGTVMTVTHFNEAFPQTIFIKNGQYVRSAPWQFEAYAAGYDADSGTFLAGVTASGAVGTGPQPLAADGTTAGFPSVNDIKSPDYWIWGLQNDTGNGMPRALGGGQNPRGFAFSADGNRMYVSDSNIDAIRVLDKQETRWAEPIAVTGTTRLQMAGGLLWAIRGASVVAIDPATSKVIRTLSPADVLTPVSMTADRWGRLLVGDAHPERRRIAIFDPATGKRVATFGKLGGPWGPGQVPGRSGNAVFEYPLGLGCDAAGNLYVGDAGGGWPQNGSVTCFKPLAKARSWSTVPVWSVRGSSWCDTVALDPDDPTVLYSAWYKYKFDYAAPPGKGWKLTGTTFNKIKYPQEARNNHRGNGRYFRGIRKIEGKKFIFSGALDIFRLGDSGAGDTAVPCALLYTRGAGLEASTAGWPFNAPSYRNEDGYVWTDANGDGKFDASEYRKFYDGVAEPWGTETFLYLADNADVWLLPTGPVNRHGYRHRMQGLKNDVPFYDDITQRTRVEIPTTDGIGNIFYACLNERSGDLLLLSRRDGRQDMSLTAYAGWRDLATAGKGDTATIRYRVDGIAQGPSINTNQGYAGDYIGGMRAKNEYLFLADSMGGGIRVYRADTGAAVGRLDAGDLGAHQPMDNTEGLQISVRGAGKALEYIIVRDCWLTNKMIMFRWKP